jgi:hypothetical protein
VVDFSNVEELRYTLQGVDLLISTVSNNEQLNLVDAARRARVRIFVPSEFEGELAHRPSNDPLDRGSIAALDLLERWSQSRSHNMKYTVFSCGIFMERFGPNGLQEYGIGAGCGIQSPNDYVVNVNEATAEIVETNAQGRPAQVVLTSVYDVARFVAAAIEMGPETWPREFKMRGDHMSVRDIVATCSGVRGGKPSRWFFFSFFFFLKKKKKIPSRQCTDMFQVPFTLVTHSYQEALSQAEFSREMQDWGRWRYYQRLLETANGRYFFRHPNLNEAIRQHDGVEVRPLRFRDWLQQQIWGTA